MTPTTTAPPPSTAFPYPWTTADELSDEIARIFAHRTGATYRMLVLIRAFDELDAWGARGFKSCADWFSWRVGVTPGTAREHVRVARALGTLPELSRRMEAGELSYSVARALTRVATPENEADLVEVAMGSSAAQMERLVSAWRQTDRLAEAEAAAEAERERHRSRELSLVEDSRDGSWVIRGRLACDAGVRGMIHGTGGEILDVGRKRRTVPPATRRALAFRDGGRCRFPGCTSRFCDAHHIVPWAEGGSTSLDNLVLLCRRHHRRVHEDGWRIERAEGGDGPDGGRLRFLQPDGWELPRVPERPRAPEAAVTELEREQEGLGVDAWTAVNDWLGDSMDVDLALNWLRRREPGWHGIGKRSGGGGDRNGDVSAETPDNFTPV